MPSCHRILLIALLLGPQTALSLSSSPKQVRKIEVCQNKHCCRNFVHGSLPQVLSDLTSGTSIEVEETGCLSRCDKGPNLRVTVAGDSSRMEEQYYLQGVKDHIRVATELDGFGVTVPSKFVAACTVMEKARIGTYLCVRLLPYNGCIF